MKKVLYFLIIYKKKVIALMDILMMLEVVLLAIRNIKFLFLNVD
jgi:hypothetical protein